ncbi:energy transducer TonB [Chromatocurvus halotolerans]|uniref:Protein TonB n=1 Tax=Chromatocurvus halotolerans TaxID=1132028 RepID=A0A4R2KRI5_9GAMM|nr:energy transducer TonB [Chromatocurvus halotolerans]TCO75357.1 outer membrane transport energization protein TonB [Chromatocurvus halotolerans]
MPKSLTRIVFGALLALPVAGGLFFLMQYLIATANPDIDEEERTRLADIVMPERDIDTNVEQKKPEKIEDPEEPPPDMDTPDMDTDVDANAVNTAPQSTVEINIASSGMGGGDGEYLPIVKVAPIYPRRAQSRGITGYCIVEYTVTRNGSIRDPQAVDCSPSGVFERASVKAAEKFKYKPRVVDGEPIEVAGVQNKFTFELEN